MEVTTVTSGKDFFKVHLYQTPGAYSEWQSDPVGFLRNRGLEIPKLDAAVHDAATRALQSLDFPDPKIVGDDFDGFWNDLKCPVCKGWVIGVTTVVAMAILGLVAEAFASGAGEAAAIEIAAGADEGLVARVVATIIEAGPAWLRAIATRIGVGISMLGDLIVLAFKATAAWAERNAIKAVFCGGFVEEFLSCFSSVVCKKLKECS